MPTDYDPLLATLRTDDLDNRSDRLHYATGELLGADDFRAEQLYHRRQLARALLFLHGSGTVAGLRVVAEPATAPVPATRVSDVRITVQPGLAIDRAGRLIEVPTPVSLRLRRWVDYVFSPDNPGDKISPDRLRNAFDPTLKAVVADVFLSFHPCERGWTPAFATGPFDALDASQPSRVRDSYEVNLVLRPPNPPARAFDPWATAPLGTPAEIREAILAAWDNAAPPDVGQAGDFHDCPAALDPNSVLLARLKIPAPAPPAQAEGLDWSAATWTTAPAPGSFVDNSLRNFVVPPALLRRLHNL